MLPRTWPARSSSDHSAHPCGLLRLGSFFKAGNTPAGYQTYNTTSGNFFVSKEQTRVLDVGDSNQGVVSYMSKVLHAKQQQ